MRIGLVCPYSLDAWGGVQHHVLELAADLRRRGHEVTVLAPVARRSSTPLPASVTAVPGARAVPFNGSHAHLAPRSAPAVRAWLAAHDLDVLHVHEPAAPGLSVQVLRQVAPGVGVVATHHTAQSRALVLRAAGPTVLRGVLARVDRHLAVSREAHRTLLRYHDAPAARAAEIVPNGLDVARYAPEAGAAAPDGPLLLFLGRADEPRKGLAVLARALPAVLAARPDARVVVAGGGRLPRAATRAWSGHAGRVSVLGPVSERDKVALLRAASLVVAPNLGGESFGIVLAEAMAAGTPVLASDLPGFRDVLAGGLAGALFPAGDADALAARAVALLADRPALAALGGRGRRRAQEHFDWSVVTPRVLAAYDAARGEAAATARFVVEDPSHVRLSS